ncbi:hypothetical protein EHS25_002860 [Saitozyma podzolica]|uniref:Uncharacterized protein n=1 Tax=Saitozyma podzolica TaxID=1890683 RepID=A0A427YC59_9TREE|nr:hypothetical protein EHS25_002860 [Saitozyma podzolica]
MSSPSRQEIDAFEVLRSHLARRCENAPDGPTSDLDRSVSRALGSLREWAAGQRRTAEVGISPSAQRNIRDHQEMTDQGNWSFRYRLLTAVSTQGIHQDALEACMSVLAETDPTRPQRELAPYGLQFSIEEGITRIPVSADWRWTQRVPDESSSFSSGPFPSQSAPWTDAGAGSGDEGAHQFQDGRPIGVLVSVHPAGSESVTSIETGSAFSTSSADGQPITHVGSPRMVVSVARGETPVARSESNITSIESASQSDFSGTTLLTATEVVPPFAPTPPSALPPSSIDSSQWSSQISSMPSNTQSTSSNAQSTSSDLASIPRDAPSTPRNANSAFTPRDSPSSLRDSPSKRSDSGNSDTWSISVSPGSTVFISGSSEGSEWSEDDDETSEARQHQDVIREVLSRTPTF